MIWVLTYSPSSSDSRIAPIRPSIMSLGAITSAPAARADQRLPAQGFDRDVIQNIAAVIDDAVLAVAGIGIESRIRHHPQLREGVFQGSHRARHQSVRVIGLLACWRAQ